MRDIDALNKEKKDLFTRFTESILEDPGYAQVRFYSEIKSRNKETQASLLQT